MATLAEACGPAVAFTYRSIDRLILNAYIPTLQMPGAMVTFLREVCGKPILSPVVFKALTDRFVPLSAGHGRDFSPHPAAPSGVPPLLHQPLCDAERDRLHLGDEPVELTAV
jgi:hypothetical protein